MTCVLCGPYPKWMGFDGVSLSMSKNNVLWDTVETIHPRDRTVTPLGPEVLKFQKQLLLPTPKRSGRSTSSSSGCSEVHLPKR
jgi:hypothetical protein